MKTFLMAVLLIAVLGATAQSPGDAAFAAGEFDAAARAYLRALSVAVARSHAGEALGLPETAA